MKDLRSIPSIDSLLQSSECLQMIQRFGRPLVVENLRVTLEHIRTSPQEAIPSAEQIILTTERQLEELIAPSLVRVINATGVVLHTNLGRSPLSKETTAAIETAALEYSTLEFDLESGLRGSRHIHCERLLKKLTGAEAALVVNNNASAVLLILSALMKNKKVAISRSQLVEIGGSFRVPDVMRQSGAKLMEIGTTNKTHLADYEEALRNNASAILRVHTSNFKIIGFSAIPALDEIVKTAHDTDAIVVDDLGSGAFFNTEDFGLTHEPTVQESIKAGVDVICFSGDKLLGGPQAGIIIGRKDLLDKIKKHPLARAVRADKLCLAGLMATLTHYLKDEALGEIPVWKMICLSPDVIKIRALYWQEQLQMGEVIPGESTVGGGSLPGDTLPTWLLALDIQQAAKFLKVLRTSTPHIIARIVDDRVVFDPRTVFENEEAELLDAITNAYQTYRKTK